MIGECTADRVFGAKGFDKGNGNGTGDRNGNGCVINKIVPITIMMRSSRTKMVVMMMHE